MDAFRLFTGRTHGREGLVSQPVHGKYLYLNRIKTVLLGHFCDAFMQPGRNSSNLKPLPIQLEPVACATRLGGS